MTVTDSRSWGEGTPPVDDIVAAAIRLVDEQGFAALTTRRLAMEMGVHRPNLYRRIESLDQLLGLMSDSIVAEAGLPDPSITQWREWLTDCARRLYTTWRRHPGSARLIYRGGTHDSTMRLIDRLLEIFLCGGFPEQSVPSVAQAYFAHVFGSIAAMGAQAEAQPVMERLDPAQQKSYPFLAMGQKLIAQSSEFQAGADFMVGLDVVLDGIALRRL